jgi:hypothetical protein
MRERNERAKAAKKEAARATREKFEAKVPFVGGPYDGLTLSIEYTPFGPHMGPPYFMPMSYQSERYTSSCQYGRKVTLEKGKPMWRMELTDKFTPPADAQPYFTEVEKATQGL